MTVRALKLVSNTIHICMIFNNRAELQLELEGIERKIPLHDFENNSCSMRLILTIRETAKCNRMAMDISIDVSFMEMLMGL